MKQVKYNKWKYEILTLLTIVGSIGLLAFMFHTVVTICTLIMTTVISKITSTVLINALKFITIYMGISFTFFASIFIIGISVSACVELMKRKKFEPETKYEIDDILKIYQQEKMVQTNKKINDKTKDSDSKKQNYTIEDLKKEKEKLENSLIETVEPKEKQKVLD